MSVRPTDRAHRLDAVRPSRSPTTHHPRRPSVPRSSGRGREVWEYGSDRSGGQWPEPQPAPFSIPLFTRPFPLLHPFPVRCQSRPILAASGWPNGLRAGVFASRISAIQRQNQRHTLFPPTKVRIQERKGGGRAGQGSQPYSTCSTKV